MKNEKLKKKSEKFRIGDGRALAYGEGGLRPKLEEWRLGWSDRLVVHAEHALVEAYELESDDVLASSSVVVRVARCKCLEGLHVGNLVSTPADVVLEGEHTEL